MTTCHKRKFSLFSGALLRSEDGEAKEEKGRKQEEEDEKAQKGGVRKERGGGEGTSRMGERKSTSRKMMNA